MNASSLCRSVAVVKLYQALESYVSLEITTDQFRDCLKVACIERSALAMVVGSFVLGTFRLLARDLLRVVASSTSNYPGPRSAQHPQIGQCLLPLVAANFFVDDPAGASSQRRKECICVFRPNNE